MSTKIYNAYKFLGSREELVPFLQQVRFDVQSEFLNVYSNLELSKTTSYELYDMICESIEKEKHTLNSSSCVCVFFHNSGIYLQFYFPYSIGLFSRRASHLIKKWEDKLIDFHYQNQGDKPDEISEEEWQKRADIWDEIFQTSDIPALAGFTWIIMDKVNAMTTAMKLKKEIKHEL